MECVSCTRFAALVPRFSAGISALSSIMIIYIISSSRLKLTTIYHRIMFGMSISDILSSVAIGLTTLPTPKELPFQNQYFYGTRIGNSETCNAQGFLFTFGFVTMYSYNLALFLFNTCTIVFRMKEEKIARYVEPLLHLFSLAVGLGVAIPPLVQKMYNVTELICWCTIAKDVHIMVIALSFTFLIGVAICIILIMRKVINLDRANFIQRNDEQNSSSLGFLKLSMVIGIQALAYFSSFMMTVGIVLLQCLAHESQYLDNISFVLVPLQGFFNLVIFVSQKVYNYRRVHIDTTRYEVLKILLLASAQDPILISKMSLIKEHHARAIIEPSDENKSELIHLQKMSGCAVEIDDESQLHHHDLSGFPSLESNYKNDHNSYCISSDGYGIDKNNEKRSLPSRRLSTSQQGSSTNPFPIGDLKTFDEEMNKISSALENDSPPIEL